ncbi:MAG: cell division protein FtsK [Planctomycetia bacterium]|nr:cell division protein FtsK [Planctomycetia bacterium]
MSTTPSEPAAATPSVYDRTLLRSQIDILRREAATRARLENEIHEEHETRVAAARRKSETSLAATHEKYAGEIEATKREYAAVLQKAAAYLAAEQKKLDDQRAAMVKKIGRDSDTLVQQTKEEDQFEEGSFREVFKEKKKDPLRLFAKGEKDLARSVAQIDESTTRVNSFLEGKRVATVAIDASAPAEAPEGDLLQAFDQVRTAVDDQAKAILGLPAAKTAFGGGLQAAAIALPLLLGTAAAAATFFLLPGELGLKAGAAGAAAAILAGGGIGGGFWTIGSMRSRVRTQLGDMATEFAANATRAAGLKQPCLAFLATRRDQQAAKLEERFKQESEQRAIQSEAKRAAILAKRDKSLADLEVKYKATTEAIAAKVAAARDAAEKKYPPRLAALETSRREDIERIERERDDSLAAADAQQRDRHAAMTAQWRAAREQTAATFDEANRIDTTAFRTWDDLARDDVPLPIEPPPGLRFGSVGLTLEKLPGGVSSDPALNAFGPISWTQPAILSWPVESSLLIKTSPEEKETSSAMMQALMLRIASGIPAGQSRFTIIDPLGLGKQFAGFMHLADYDELLVTSRIWTEPQLVEQRLADITEQMEVVIQKYLRNEYESIGAYNADAEVPEPYRFVVVANFPANFNETSARRLASIASSGARCGVYVILSIDPTQQMPAGFSLADIEQQCTTLVLKNGVYTWKDAEYSKWPLTVEQAPSDEVFTRIIQRVGKAAKSAKRVIVPFDRVAPAEDQWWKGSTAEEVLAPLGPAGAKKLQFLKLGKGTSQHCLIAGKTGSGKSTLMHAMITSLALQYSPNEIQFYLIDFKKGVEFKLYDHYALPHARVIAIESEREFGLSVMEQLDRELKRRGDLFRELSVQNVAGFRQTGHPDPMPRILLIIDEFQEIFVEDDKIAQDASLILDRLVRQGRAFGIHVLLGSQTLGGSYSLPRATMGQMAVRIALQCNEADSSLILSEDNTAARLLTRPGEAIYNDANGMVEGNNPFQVVFLTDEQREQFLGSLRKLADRRTDIPHLERIVFDGNQAADPAGNLLLTELLASGTVHGAELVAPLAWMGDAIAIKDPTAAIFRRQGGANMLIVGQREDLGASLLAISLVSLAAGLDPHPGGALGRPGRFVLLEPAIAEERPDILLSQLAGHLPHEIEVVGRFGVADACERLAMEVKRRLDEQVQDGEAVFVIVRDLGRFRELRKSDGDFGFSLGDKKAGPADNFLTVLKDGPSVGIHMIIWCDSLTNLQRTFDRNAVKEFELRVLFQMSGNDSSQLVDSPVAAKLGPQRALFIHEETGTLEKFRPYSFPTTEWLDTVAAEMRKRPQGTPVERPAARAASAAAEPTAAGDGGGGMGGFTAFGGGGEFNFSKMLDDLPGGDAAAPDGEPGGPPA